MSIQIPVKYVGCGEGYLLSITQTIDTLETTAKMKAFRDTFKCVQCASSPYEG